MSFGFDEDLSFNIGAEDNDEASSDHRLAAQLTSSPVRTRVSLSTEALSVSSSINLLGFPGLSIDFTVRTTPTEKPESRTPSAETPAADKPAPGKPAPERPAADKPATDTARAEEHRPAEKPEARTPSAETPTADKPAPGKPAPGKPAPERPAADKPAENRSDLPAQRPGAKEPQSQSAENRPPQVDRPTSEPRAQVPSTRAGESRSVENSTPEVPPTREREKPSARAASEKPIDKPIDKPADKPSPVSSKPEAKDSREDSSRDAGREVIRHGTRGRVEIDAWGRPDRVVDASGTDTGFGYTDGKITSYTHNGSARWTTADGLHWTRQGTNERWTGRVTVDRNGEIKYTDLAEDGRTVIKESTCRMNGTMLTTYADSSRVEYDHNLQPTMVRNARASVTHFQYYPDGQLQVMEDSKGRFVRSRNPSDLWTAIPAAGDNRVDRRAWRGRVEVDIQGNITERSGWGEYVNNRDGSQRVTRSGVSVARDRDNRVTSVRNSGGGETSFTYSGSDTQPVRMAEGGVTWNRRPGTNDWYRGDIRTGQADRTGAISIDPDSGIIRQTSDQERHTLPEGNTRVAAPALGAADLAEHAITIFHRIDTNGNGFITRRELAAAMANPEFTGHDAQAIAAMWVRFDKIKRLSSDENLWESDISQDDLRELARLARSSSRTTEQTELVEAFEGRGTRTAQAQQSAANGRYELYTGTNPVSADAISQGSIGNCYFMSSLAALAERNPQAIRNMIWDNGNGTYTVKFPGAKESVTVTRPTDAEMGVYGRSSNGSGLWPCILEKAYSTIHETWFDNNAYEGSDGGGLPGSAMDYLTGGSCSGLSVEDSEARNRVREAIRQGKPIVASTGTDWGGLRSDTEGGFARSHAYTIVNYDAATDRITIRNPWGNQAGPGGLTTITWAEFERNFHRMTIQD